MAQFSRACVVGLGIALVGSAAQAQHFTDWSPPVNLGAVVNSAAGDFFPAISKDGLSLYFTSSRPGGFGGWDIYVSQRDTLASTWGSPTNLGPAINSAFDEGAPAFSPDGHRMYFSSNRPGGLGGNDLYVSRRHNKRDDFGWTAPENLGAGVNTAANEASPSVYEDDWTGDIVLYFDSNRIGGPGPTSDDAGHNGNDIYQSVLEHEDVFGTATLVEAVNSSAADRQPSVRRDGLELYFSSARLRADGSNGFLDLWVSTRRSTRDAWSPPVNVLSVNGAAANDAGPALSFDGTTLYFQSIGVVGGSTQFDLYVAERSKAKGGVEH